MRKFLSRVWEDVKKGENIDLYITILAAIGLATLNILGHVPQQSIIPITLAVLSLISVNLLGSRYRIDELLRRSKVNTSDFFLEEFPQGLKKDFEEASEVWLLGISLSRTVKTNYNLIEKKLQKGHKIKVLLVHPEGRGIEVAVYRNYGRRDVAEKARDIENTLFNLCDIHKKNKGDLEIRTTIHPLTYGGFIINPNSNSGILYLENYQYRLATESLPRFILRESDGKWFDFYIKEIIQIWNDSSDWICS